MESFPITQSRIFYVAVTTALVPFALVNLNSPQSFTGYALASAFLTHLITEPNPREWCWGASVGLVLNRAAQQVAFLRHLPTIAPSFSIAMLGAGSLIVLGWRLICAADREKEHSAAAFLQSIVLLALVLVSQLMLRTTSLRGPYVFDSYLLSFDQSLGWRLPSLIESFVRRAPLIHYFAEVAYNGLPMIAAAVCAAYIRSVKAVHWQLFKAIVTAGAVGWMVYLIFPAVGPRYCTSPGISMAPPLPPSPGNSYLLQLQVPLGVARNAMPSLHMTWALLIWFNSRALPRAIRGLALLYALLTPVVVLVLGEHYLIDLVVAIPFSLAVQAICTGDRRVKASARRRAALTGVLACAAWLVLLRFGTSILIFTPFVSWSCVIISCTVSAFMIRQILVPSSKGEGLLDASMPNLRRPVAASENAS